MEIEDPIKVEEMEKYYKKVMIENASELINGYFNHTINLNLLPYNLTNEFLGLETEYMNNLWLDLIGIKEKKDDFLEKFLEILVILLTNPIGPRIKRHVLEKFIPVKFELDKDFLEYLEDAKIGFISHSFEYVRIFEYKDFCKLVEKQSDYKYLYRFNIHVLPVKLSLNKKIR